MVATTTIWLLPATSDPELAATRQPHRIRSWLLPAIGSGDPPSDPELATSRHRIRIRLLHHRIRIWLLAHRIRIRLLAAIGSGSGYYTIVQPPWAARDGLSAILERATERGCGVRSPQPP